MSFIDGFRHGWREIRSQRAVSAVAVLTLALGVGGATTMFATLRALGASTVPPGVNPARVGRIVWTNRHGAGREPLTGAEFGQLAKAATAFDALSASADRLLTAGRPPSRTVAAKLVTPDFFRMFPCRPHAGRLLGASDSSGPAGPALVGQSLAGRDPTLRVNGILTLGGDDHGIVGVTPESCWFPSPGGPEVWLPMPAGADGLPAVPSVTVTFRVVSGAALERARSQLEPIGRRMAAADRRDPSSRRLRAITLEEDAGKRLGMGIAGFLGPALAILLIACANVANLLLARAARREREMAIRASLGGTRWRLVRERLAEGACLAAAGGVAGIVLAAFGVRLVRAWVGGFGPAVAVAGLIRLDGRATMFALAVTAAIPLVFGIVPALAASRPNLVAALHQVSGPRRPRRGPYGSRDLLVIVEVGLAVVLVVTTGMFAHFFAELNRVEWGFDPARVLAMPLPSSPAPPGRSAVIVPDLLREVRGVPGVRAAALGDLPAIPRNSDGDQIEFEGCAAPGPHHAWVSTAGAAYFDALGLPVLRGRGIGAQDAGARTVGVIGAWHASRCWPGGDPIGKRFRLGQGSPWTTIVGVAADTMRTRAFPNAPRRVYLAPDGQGAGDVLVIRFDGPSAPVVRGVRAAVLRVAPNEPLEALVRLDEEFQRRVGAAPLLVGLIGGFGGLALLLGALGVFSVMSYTVAERTREFGIRTALGSSRLHVLQLVLRHAFVVVFVGTAASAAGSLAVARATFPEMAHLAAGDPRLWASVAGLLALLALVASALPAWRAVSVEPTEALRAE